MSKVKCRLTRYEQLLSEFDNSETMLISTDSVRQPAESMCIDNEYAIFMNDSAFETEAERFVALAHEKGHCDSGALYNVHTPLITRGRCERRAWDRVVRDNLPPETLEAAFRACKTGDGEVMIYDVAEYLGVTEAFVKLAVETYERKGQPIKF